MKTLTVFTPTYNRAHTLGKCFESLKEQTSGDFVWQIVDDGSTDNTEQLVKDFIKTAGFEIKYVKKENGGKVSAINKSLEITKTPLWVCLDSDDYFTPDAVRIIIENYPAIKDKKDICGLFALRSKPDLTPMQGMSIPEDVKYATQHDIRAKYGIPPEYVQVYKTAIASNYKYPIFKGEKYMPLSYVQDQMDEKYKFFILRDPLMVCEYFPDGITQNHHKLVKNNPNGYIEFRRQQIVLSKSFKSKAIACITYDTGNIIAHKKGWIKNSPAKALCVLCYPAAKLDYYRRYKNL